MNYALVTVPKLESTFQITKINGYWAVVLKGSNRYRDTVEVLLDAAYIHVKADHTDDSYGLQALAAITKTLENAGIGAIVETF